MSEFVTTLERTLARRRPGLLASLQAGAPLSEVDDFARRVGSALPPLWRDLLTWRNGQPQPLPGMEPFVDHWYFLPVGSAAELWGQLTGMQKRGEFAEPFAWRPLWVPFMSALNGDLLCIDLEGSHTGAKGQVLEFRHDNDARCAWAPSLEAYLRVFVENTDRIRHGCALVVAVVREMFAARQPSPYRIHCAGFPREFRAQG